MQIEINSNINDPLTTAYEIYRAAMKHISNTYPTGCSVSHGELKFFQWIKNEFVLSFSFKLTWVELDAANAFHWHLHRCLDNTIMKLLMVLKSIKARWPWSWNKYAILTRMCYLSSTRTEMNCHFYLRWIKLINFDKQLFCWRNSNFQI